MRRYGIYVVVVLVIVLGMLGVVYLLNGGTAGINMRSDDVTIDSEDDNTPPRYQIIEPKIQQITLSDQGLNKEEITVQSDTIIEFSNTTDESIEVEVTGAQDMTLPVVEPGESVRSLPFISQGIYKASVGDEKLEITVE